MKKLIAMLLAALMVLGLFAGCAPTENEEAPNNESQNNEANNEAEGTGENDDDAPALNTIEPGKLIMSTNAQFPPYEMTTDDGGYAGIDVEIAQAIADYLGLELVIDDMDFDGALMAVQQGKSDIVMACVTVNEDRKLVMDFSDTYATGIQVVIVKEGSPITLDNVGEYMIGTQRGTTGEIYATDEYGADHVTTYDSGLMAVNALVNGQIDCVIIDNAPAEEFVKANPGLAIIDGAWVEEEYAIGFGKNNPELVEAVNGALQALTEDGTIQAILDKYIKAE